MPYTCDYVIGLCASYGMSTNQFSSRRSYLPYTNLENMYAAIINDCSSPGDTILALTEGILNITVIDYIHLAF